MSTRALEDHAMQESHDPAVVCGCDLCVAPPRRRRRSGPPLGRKLRVLDRDGWTCRYCGDPAATVDHVIPRSRGGANSMDNLVAACLACNTDKADTMPEAAS